MQYCTFSFAVHYNNRKVKTGIAPFRGENLNEQELALFVQDYFSGAPGSYNTIEVKIEQTFPDEEQWIRAIQGLEAFRYLQKVNNYAGDLLEKYTLQ